MRGSILGRKLGLTNMVSSSGINCCPHPGIELGGRRCKDFRFDRSGKRNFWPPEKSNFQGRSSRTAVREKSKKRKEGFENLNNQRVNIRKGGWAGGRGGESAEETSWASSPSQKAPRCPAHSGFDTEGCKHSEKKKGGSERQDS